jgi:hypothetical protein
LYLYEKLIPTDDWEKPANTTPLADIAKLATRKRAPTVTPYDPTGHN